MYYPAKKENPILKKTFKELGERELIEDTGEPCEPLLMKDITFLAVVAFAAVAGVHFLSLFF